MGAGSNLTSGTLNTSAWAGVTNANRVSSSQVHLADNTANDWYITGIQLEVGDKATPFEHQSFGDVLKQCERFYEKTYQYSTVPGTSASYADNFCVLGSCFINICGDVPFNEPVNLLIIIQLGSATPSKSVAL